MSRFIVLPRGVPEKTFASALQEYRTALGEDRVRTDPASLETYMRTTLAGSDELRRPSAVIFPATGREVQAVVAVANRYKTPLWTVYSGENAGYGDAAPATPGQIVLDLKNMKKIIEVDQELGYSLLEPGVTYAELQQYLRKNNINLWLDAPGAAAETSVAGNILERGCGYTPYSEHFLFSCGMEVVLADGSVLRTGMGGVANSTSWQVFKWGFGPYVDGLFSQANNGIVTKLGTWLMGAPPPGGYIPFCIRFPRTEMIGDIFKQLVFLRQAQIVPNACAVVNSVAEAATRSALGGNGSGQRNGTGIGAWNLYGAVYGSPEQAALNMTYVTATFRGLFGSGIRIITEKEAKDDPVFRYRKQLMMGEVTPAVPTDSRRGFMQFSPTAAARPAECSEQVKVATEVLRSFGFEYHSEFIVGWRDARHLIDLRFDRTRPDEMKRAHRCYDRLVTVFTKHGWGINRTNTAFMDKVARAYGPEMRRLNRTIKKALDPNNILSPGKAGISAD
jgi:4-cresol dehydrogenase (hydroxylating)